MMTFFSCHKIHQAFQFQCIHGMTSILVGFGRVGVTTIGPEKNLNLGQQLILSGYFVVNKRCFEPF